MRIHSITGVLCNLLASSLAAPSVTLEPSNVMFEGVTADEYRVEQFMNIRFGHDTSGSNRFRHPKAFQYTENSIVDASMTGTACPQQYDPIPGLPYIANVTNISKDCLTLRIARPEGISSDAKLAVMVWLYGGGDSIGQIYDTLYDPSPFVANSWATGHPIIYAAVNYREGNLNAALLDQLMGIEWIKSNIAAFGGDPDNITIFGESDGATSVGPQVTAYGGNGTASFRRAIMESKSAAADPGVASDFAFNSTKLLQQQLNCTSASGNDSVAMDCLRSLPLDVLLSNTIAVEEAVLPPLGFEVFIADIVVAFPLWTETSFLRHHRNFVRHGRFYKNVSMLFGWNEQDGTAFVMQNSSSDADVTDFLRATYPGLRKETISEILEYYPVSEFQSAYSLSAQYYRLAAMYRDAEFVCPSLMLADQVHKYGETSYLFSLNQTIFAESDQALLPLGVMHASDLPYVFNTASLFRNTTVSDDILATELSTIWTTYASTGEIPASYDWPQAFKCAHNATWPENANIRVFGGQTHPNPGFTRRMLDGSCCIIVKAPCSITNGNPESLRSLRSLRSTAGLPTILALSGESPVELMTQPYIRHCYIY
ncbi:alpha/beta-hydrolase [Lipomyces starkeyi]